MNNLSGKINIECDNITFKLIDSDTVKAKDIMFDIVLNGNETEVTDHGNGCYTITEIKQKPEGCKNKDKICRYIKGGIAGELCDYCR